MNNIVRAWKDEAYRQSLSAEEQAVLPGNPVGEIELTEAELEAIAGAAYGTRPSIDDIDGGDVQSRTEQIITFQPVLGGGGALSISILGSGANQCNNYFSPVGSRATDQHQP